MPFLNTQSVWTIFIILLLFGILGFLTGLHSKPHPITNTISKTKFYPPSPSSRPIPSRKFHPIQRFRLPNHQNSRHHYQTGGGTTGEAPLRAGDEIPEEDQLPLDIKQGVNIPSNIKKVIQGKTAESVSRLPEVTPSLCTHDTCEHDGITKFNFDAVLGQDTVLNPVSQNALAQYYCRLLSDAKRARKSIYPETKNMFYNDDNTKEGKDKENPNDYKLEADPNVKALIDPNTGKPLSLGEIDHKLCTVSKMTEGQKEAKEALSWTGKVLAMATPVTGIYAAGALTKDLIAEGTGVSDEATVQSEKDRADEKEDESLTKEVNISFDLGDYNPATRSCSELRMGGTDCPGGAGKWDQYYESRDGDHPNYCDYDPLDFSHTANWHQDKEGKKDQEGKDIKKRAIDWYKDLSDKKRIKMHNQAGLPKPRYDDYLKKDVRRSQYIQALDSKTSDALRGSPLLTPVIGVGYSTSLCYAPCRNPDQFERKWDLKTLSLAAMTGPLLRSPMGVVAGAVAGAATAQYPFDCKAKCPPNSSNFGSFCKKDTFFRGAGMTLGCSKIPEDLYKKHGYKEEDFEVDLVTKRPANPHQLMDRVNFMCYLPCKKGYRRALGFGKSVLGTVTADLSSGIGCIESCEKHGLATDRLTGATCFKGWDPTVLTHPTRVDKYFNGDENFELFEEKGVEDDYKSQDLMKIDYAYNLLENYLWDGKAFQYEDKDGNQRYKVGKNPGSYGRIFDYDVDGPDYSGFKNYKEDGKTVSDYKSDGIGIPKDTKNKPKNWEGEKHIYEVTDDLYDGRKTSYLWTTGDRIGNLDEARQRCCADWLPVMWPQRIGKEGEADETAVEYEKRIKRACNSGVNEGSKGEYLNVCGKIDIDRIKAFEKLGLGDVGKILGDLSEYGGNVVEDIPFVNEIIYPPCDLVGAVRGYLLTPEHDPRIVNSKGDPDAYVNKYFSPSSSGGSWKGGNNKSAYKDYGPICSRRCPSSMIDAGLTCLPSVQGGTSLPVVGEVIDSCRWLENSQVIKQKKDYITGKLTDCKDNEIDPRCKDHLKRGLEKQDGLEVEWEKEGALCYPKCNSMAHAKRERARAKGEESAYEKGEWGGFMTDCYAKCKKNFSTGEINKFRKNNNCGDNEYNNDTCPKTAADLSDILWEDAALFCFKEKEADSLDMGLTPGCSPKLTNPTDPTSAKYEYIHDLQDMGKPKCFAECPSGTSSGISAFSICSRN